MLITGSLILVLSPLNRPTVPSFLGPLLLNLGSDCGSLGLRCKTIIWLAIQNRCWTADRLQKGGLPHLDHCPLYDQEDETVQHILTTCVFARQFWFAVLLPLNLVILVPNRRSVSLADLVVESFEESTKTT